METQTTAARERDGERSVKVARIAGFFIAVRTVSH